MAKRCARRRKRSRGNQGLECKEGIRLERSGGAGLGRGASGFRAAIDLKP
jgi:hypothetical protein